MFRGAFFAVLAAAVATREANATSSSYYESPGDTPSPNEPIPKPECNESNPVSIRYSSTTGRLYLESASSSRGGCVSIDQIWEYRGGGTSGAKPPLYAVDPDSGNISDTITGTWLLDEDLYVEDGITLRVCRCFYPLDNCCLVEVFFR